MRIVGRHILDDFCRTYPDGRQWVENWLADVTSAVWTAPVQIKSAYAAASFLAGNVVIFNVKGNSYRLETTIAYRTGVVEVTWAGTHANYDRRNSRRGQRK